MIRSLVEADLQRLCDIESQCHSPPWQWQHFAASLSRDVCFGFEQCQQLSGYIIWRLVAGQVDLLNLSVATSCRRVGIATGLLLHCIQSCQRQGVETILLDVRSNNVAAIELYQKFEFKRIAQRQNFYSFGECRDAITMQKILGS